VQAAASQVKGSEMKAIAGKLADAESMLALKDLMNRLGCGNLMHEAVRGSGCWLLAAGCWLLLLTFMPLQAG
jgi:hypothetical protein